MRVVKAYLVSYTLCFHCRLRVRKSW